MRRREFITLLGGAAVTRPLAARAQQSTIPVIGYLSIGSLKTDTSRLSGLWRGLNEIGYVEGRNCAIEYRWAENQADRLPALIGDLIQLQVTAIVATGVVPALAAKAATTSIPIVFVIAADPVRLGLVASLNRPGDNLTGFNGFNSEFGAKALALLHELVPSTATVGFLGNPSNPIFELTTKDLLAAGSVIGVKVQVLKAGTDREIEAAFMSLAKSGTEALLVEGDATFNSRIEQIVALAARHAIPTMYSLREFAVAGGLISYGNSLMEMYRQIGLYTGRILKGEKPADLPVQQETRIELVINLKTAKKLGLKVPDSLLTLANEVIE
jgi:putative ABC transport system substrate-binding protein